MKKLDLTGHVYGRLTVISEALKRGRHTMYNCLCECGLASVAYATNLRSGYTTSCGCLRTELHSTQGGGSNNAAYKNWESMVARCHNIKHDQYEKYGAIGVHVHLPWRYDFQAFLRYIGPKPTVNHTIDRIENALGYIPGNVRWATHIEQKANRSNTAKVMWNGELQTLAILAHEHNLPPQNVYARVFGCGWSVERALNTPILTR
jgi:hypothetical protein